MGTSSTDTLAFARDARFDDLAIAMVISPFHLAGLIIPIQPDVYEAACD
jgi:hypothetical protein